MNSLICAVSATLIAIGILLAVQAFIDLRIASIMRGRLDERHPDRVRR